MAQKNAPKSTPRAIVTRPAAHVTYDDVPANIVAVPMGTPVDGETLRKYTMEHVVKIQEGHQLEGTYQGPGAPIEFTDDESGEVREINTWRIETAQGVIARVMGSAGLDKHMEGLKAGDVIIIVRGPQTETRKGRRVNQFVVGHRK